MAAPDAIEIGVVRDVLFGHGGEHELRADVYAPRSGPSKRTAIVSLHGGGFNRGSKDRPRMAAPLAALGYTCISAEYRLGHQGFWPAPIEDVKACIRWTRSNADRLNIEPGRIAIMGFSAGARLALIAAGSANQPDLEGVGGFPDIPTDLAACIAFYAPAGDAVREQANLHPSLGPNATDDDFKAFSPITYLLRENYAPTILFHGTADRAVPAETSVLVYQALTESKTKVELHLLEGLGHGFDTNPEFADSSAVLIDLFLDRHVVNPRSLRGVLSH